MLIAIGPSEVKLVNSDRLQSVIAQINGQLLEPDMVNRICLADTGGRRTYMIPLRQPLNQEERNRLMQSFSDAGWGATLENALIPVGGQMYKDQTMFYLLLTKDYLEG